MKKVFIFIVIFIILISSIPIYATNYNDGPDPSNEYYTHIITTWEQSLDWGVKKQFSREVYIYDQPYLGNEVDGVVKLAVNPASFPNNSALTDAYQSIKVYESGVDITPSNMIYNLLYGMSVSGINITYDEFINGFNSGLIEANKLDMQNILNYKLEVVFNTISYVNTNGDTIIYPQASPLPEYDDYGYIKQTTLPNGYKMAGSKESWDLNVQYQIPTYGEYFNDDWQFTLYSDQIKKVKNGKITNQQIGIYDYSYLQSNVMNTYYVPFGVSQAVWKITNLRTNEFYITPVYTFENYPDFVDVDGDGRDDRTGQTVGAIDNIFPDIGDIPTGDLQDWSLTTVFSNLQLLFTKYVNGVNGLIVQIGQMGVIFNTLNQVIPPEIIALLTTSIITLIILKIFGR